MGGQPKRNGGKPGGKWKFVLIGVLAVVVLGSVFGGKKDTAAPDDIKKQEPHASEPAASQDAEPVVPVESDAVSSEGDLGKHRVSIGDARLSKDHDGSPVFIVSYAWTNGTDETKSSWVCVSPKAFQNGIELESAIFVQDESYSSDMYMADIRPGTTVDIQRAYVLTDPDAPVEFELTEYISFSNKAVTKIFDLSSLGIDDYRDAFSNSGPSDDDGSGSGETVSEGPGIGTVNGHHVEVKGAVLGRDYHDDPAIVVTVSWTNNSEKTVAFASQIRGQAFQDGIELETAIMLGDSGHDGQLYITDRRPGATLDVTLAYTLRNESSVIEFELDKPITVGSSNPVSIEFDPSQLGANVAVQRMGSDVDASMSVLNSLELQTKNVMNGSGTQPLGKRAYVELSTEEFEAITSDELVRFAREKVDGSGYNWVSILCFDGRGLVFTGSEITFASYGTVDDMGRIESVSGYIKLSGDAYIYAN